ncbi:MAG TPA: exosortase/archaeosortase family protein [Terriglobales bacterium]|nr:exosortase/archaeosortase family protein [Terriglobales bacterium]
MQFCALVGISVALWWGALAETFLRSLHDDQYTHILVILPVSLAFFFLERKKMGLYVMRSSTAVYGIFFAVALGLFFAAQQPGIIPDEFQLTLSVTGLIVWWIGSFIGCFGLSAFRIFLFPLCFLFWMVPWPHSLLDLLIHMLQQYSASGVSWTFQLFGIPVLRDGVILSIPGLTIEVARECSSIRSSLILVVSSMVLAQFFLRSIARKTIVTLIAIPLSVAKNVVRIFTLSMLGVHVNPGFLTGRLHHRGGVVFYAAALGVIFLLIYWFQRQEANSPPRKALEAALR